MNQFVKFSEIKKKRLNTYCLAKENMTECKAGVSRINCPYNPFNCPFVNECPNPCIVSLYAVLD